MRIRYSVLLSALLPLLVFAVLALLDPAGLVVGAKAVSDWLLDHFDWLFNWTIFGCLITVVVVYASPLGKVRIGGAAAVPLLSRWRWLAITVCTTIATGVLFWGVAEPLFHLLDTPPAGVEAPEVFALSTLFLHWTIIPYAMYTVGGLLFAIGFYNRNQPFALSTLLEPLFGNRIHRRGGAIVDTICLFALVAGMAASLGAGALSLLGGWAYQGGADAGTSATGLAVVTGSIVLAFSISAVSGLQRGIRVLSNLNFIGFILLACFIFLTGAPGAVLELTASALRDFTTHFVPRSLGLDPGIPRAWTHDWTSFYWANWYAWAPVTALFLGRISVGYTVREFIRVNLLYTSLFGAFWMVAIGGTALSLDGTGGGALSGLVAGSGAEYAAYGLLDALPLVRATAPFFLLLVFLSYVTAADSNVTAIGALCTTGIRPDQQEAPLGVKLLWGFLIGLTAWVLVAYAGLDGIRLISTLGGFPAMLLISLAGVCLLKLAFTSPRTPAPPPGARRPPPARPPVRPGSGE